MRFANPSREDAWDLTRNEKMCLTFLTNTASALAESKDGLSERIDRIEHGQDRIDRLVSDSLELLNDIRMTVPEKQRVSLVNTANDYEIRLTPKYTPSSHNVIVQKEDFRTLVDAAQAKCVECTDDNEECRKCKLFNLLVTVLPLDSYDGTFMCPYSQLIHQWEN